MYYIIELLDNTDKTICQKAVKQNTVKEWSEQAILLAAKHGAEGVRCNVLCWTGCKYEHVQSFNFDQDCVDRGCSLGLDCTYRLRHWRQILWNSKSNIMVKNSRYGSRVLTSV